MIVTSRRIPQSDLCPVSSCMRSLHSGVCHDRQRPNESMAENDRIRNEDDKCGCGEVQNAAHLLQCPLIGDGKGRSWDECKKDREWCRAVADFLG